MDRREFLSRSIGGVLVGGTCCCTGCGTMFHSDRVGQPHSRDIDWKVAGLNALGLAFFFVPGAAAFAVDFYTGAIYLPHESYEGSPGYQPYGQSPPMGLTHGEPSAQPNPASQFDPSDAHPTEQQPQPSLQRVGSAAFRRVDIASADLDQRGIENVVAQHVGRTIALTDSNIRVSPLSRLEHFATAYHRHRSDPRFGFSPRQFFERLPTV
jgi:hypothetical protein